MILSDYVTTLGTVLRARYGEREHKVSIDAGFACPNRDGINSVDPVCVLRA
jgi:uncharacterized protein